MKFCLSKEFPDIDVKWLFGESEKVIQILNIK